MLDSLCEAAGRPKVPLRVVDRNVTTRLGEYRHARGRGLGVSLWNRTKARGAPIAAKSSLETPCHEFMHHYEISGGLAKSFHTAAFGRRTRTLYRTLLEKAGA